MSVFATDALTQAYAEFLDGSYDVVDRIVLNAYFRLGQSPGGFRTWWRQLHGGRDDTLDDPHLMRWAGRFARRLRAWAQKHRVPVVQCSAGDRTGDLAKSYLPQDPSFRGIFCVLIKRAPAPVWEVASSQNGGIHLRRKRPWVNHYAFHILDDEWGHLTIKMCGHPPFSAQILLNGHEYVACRARKAGVVFSKEGNCFTQISDARALAECAETLRTSAAVGRLGQVLERWIVTCAAFGVSVDEQHATHFKYSYSVYQVELSRNLLFQSGAVMDQVFEGLIDRCRGPLNFKTIKTLFGAKQRPRGRGGPPRLEAVVERPAYDLTVFKVHFGRRTLKLYTKGERVLRIEAIVHNTKELRCGKVLERFPRIVDTLGQIVERSLGVLRSVDAPFISDTTLDDLATAGHVGSARVAGIDMNQPRIRAVIEAVVALSASAAPFTSATLAARVRPILQAPYTSRQAAYDLRKLRAKALVDRVPRRIGYEATSEGLRTMTALLVLRDKVLKPVLAAVRRPARLRASAAPMRLDAHYQRLREDMNRLLCDLRIAA